MSKNPNTKEYWTEKKRAEHSERLLAYFDGVFSCPKGFTTRSYLRDCSDRTKAHWKHMTKEERAARGVAISKGRQSHRPWEKASQRMKS